MNRLRNHHLCTYEKCHSVLLSCYPVIQFLFSSGVDLGRLRISQYEVLYGFETRWQRFYWILNVDRRV